MPFDVLLVSSTCLFCFCDLRDLTLVSVSTFLVSSTSLTSCYTLVISAGFCSVLHSFPRSSCLIFLIPSGWTVATEALLLVLWRDDAADRRAECWSCPIPHKKRYCGVTLSHASTASWLSVFSTLFVREQQRCNLLYIISVIIHTVKWRHRIYDDDTFAILWV